MTDSRNVCHSFQLLELAVGVLLTESLCLHHVSLKTVSNASILEFWFFDSNLLLKLFRIKVANNRSVILWST
ncbi:hypothetical protein CHUAL_010293 [Chamberlinius hualienensis]